MDYIGHNMYRKNKHVVTIDFTTHTHTHTHTHIYIYIYIYIYKYIQRMLNDVLALTISIQRTLFG